jgi:hypothetical protein
MRGVVGDARVLTGCAGERVWGGLVGGGFWGEKRVSTYAFAGREESEDGERGRTRERENERGAGGTAGMTADAPTQPIQPAST